MTDENATFSPVCPNPLVITPKQRAKELKGLLEEEGWQFQRLNILKLIDLYERDNLQPPMPGDDSIWLLDGEILKDVHELDDLPHVSKPSALWHEKVEMQLMQLAQRSVITNSNVYLPRWLRQLHTGRKQGQKCMRSATVGSMFYVDFADIVQVIARFRLAPQFGGNANTSINVSIANDTGSGIQTVFAADLANLNYNPNTYAGQTGSVQLLTAASSISRPRIAIEMQIIDASNNALTPWFLESAVITPDNLSLKRLSGKTMRNYLYLATAPGNDRLYAAVKKNCIVSQLPVV